VKTTTYKRVSRDKLGKLLPESFAAQLPQSITEPVTAVVFRDEVVTGRIARKALERIGTDFGASLVFAARDFTQEATEFAASHGIIVITSDGSWGGYFWSDATRASVRTALGTHRPLDVQPATESNSDATGNA
jgi:hypothetical protein